MYLVKATLVWPLLACGLMIVAIIQIILWLGGTAPLFEKKPAVKRAKPPSPPRSQGTPERIFVPIQKDEPVKGFILKIAGVMIILTGSHLICYGSNLILRFFFE